jgi:hypothetical protein
MRRRGLLALPGVLLLCAADEPADPNPDATLEIEEVRVGFLFLGGAVGGGRLRYRGQEHSFSVAGLSAGSVGISMLRARGEVFGLERLDDFPGTYVEFQAGGAAGQAELQVRWLRNANGVRLRLRSLRAGVVLEVSATGVVIGLKP